MRKDDVFESDRLQFCGINEADADCLVRWRSNPEVIRYFYDPTPVTKESHLKWYWNRYLLDNSRFDFIVKEKESGVQIGFVSIKDICEEKCSGEISYTIAEKEFQRKGYAKEAIGALMTYLRKDITVVYADVHRENMPSIRTITSLGFEVKGTRGGPFVRYQRENL